MRSRSLASIQAVIWVHQKLMGQLVTRLAIHLGGAHQAGLHEPTQKALFEILAGEGQPGGMQAG